MGLLLALACAPKQPTSYPDTTAVEFKEKYTSQFEDEEIVDEGFGFVDNSISCPADRFGVQIPDSMYIVDGTDFGIITTTSKCVHYQSILWSSLPSGTQSVTTQDGTPLYYDPQNVKSI